ncbi:DUF6241 domain-containing protein [Carnobacterium pleistocenium]|uniref:DUF6241 domain-containing protein n=1 Tax=Carnobacterium pleistocenium TaxID=181073 RepID=UPI00054FF549|nr:DUF6241 domain-containing protein [Carnobacterium pleistocenium]
MKKFLIVLGSIVAIGGVVFITFPYIEKARINLIEETARNQIGKTKAVKSSESVESVIVEKESRLSHPVRGNYLPFEEGEEEFMQDIHDMTHQKVYAEDKWGSVELNEQNINALLSILDETNFADEDYYREVFNLWKEGDFSDSVEVHNKIWKDQGGFIGKAERLLTAEEEQELVETNFR